MKYISREVTVFRHVFGSFDLSTNTVTAKTTIETAESLSDRALIKMSADYGALLATTKEKRVIKIPVDMFVTVGSFMADENMEQLTITKDDDEPLGFITVMDEYEYDNN